MNLAIIGAGESSRLKEEGLLVPKHLIRIGNETIIERIIRIARVKGFEKVLTIINSKEPELKEFLENYDFQIDLELIVKDTESSMHSFFELAKRLENEPFLLTTSDSVFNEFEFNNFVDYAVNESDATGTLAVTDFIDDEKPLCVELNNSSEIISFSDEAFGYKYATGGLYFFEPEVFDYIETALEKKISRMRNFLRHLLDNKVKLEAYKFSKIIDVDHVKDIQEAVNFITNISQIVNE